jgi:membrane associated rhomboid family serine protease
MIPLRDNIPSRTYPIVTIGLIAVNSAVFLYEVSLGARLGSFLATFGLVPARYFHLVEVEGSYISRFLPFLTSIFLHGGWFHIIGNMWYLWIFGDNVEDRMGHVRYFFFYILCGIAAGLAHLLTNSSSGIPTVGASGSIAGIMGAYLILYPRANVWTLIPIFFFVRFVELPAFILLGFWIFIQFISGTSALASSSSQGGVAWWAHIGGFVAGAALVFVFKKRRRHVPKRYADEYWPW